MSKSRKLILSIVSLLLALLLFVGCSGAVITTELTADNDFAGKREIYIDISKSQLDEYVNGGAETLASIAKKTKPEGVKFQLITNEDGVRLRFLIEFESIEEYRTIINNAISAGSNKELIPDISYENTETIFKSGLMFKENFTSTDILQWYIDELVSQEIISHTSTSDWLDAGDTTFTINEKTYDTGAEISINEQEINCLDSLDVVTGANKDGSFERTLTFKAYEPTVQKIADNGYDLEAYLKALVPSGGMFEHFIDDNDYYCYVITFNAMDSAELTQKTDAVLQTANTFSLEAVEDTENKGHAIITVKEKIDGSFFLNYDYNPVKSTINLYDNVTFSPANETSGAELTDGALIYHPLANSEYVYTLEWLIGFKNVDMKANLGNPESVNMELCFSVDEELSSELKQVALSSLSDAVSYGGEVVNNEDGNSATVKFAGTAEQTAINIDSFIATFVNDEEGYSDEVYFTIEMNKLETTSKFTSGYTGEIFYNFAPISGITNVTIHDIDEAMFDQYFNGNFALNEEGVKTVTGSETLSFTTVSVDIVPIIIAGVFALILLAGIVYGVLNIKAFKALIAAIKEKQAAKAEAKKVAIETTARPAEPVIPSYSRPELAGNDLEPQSPVYTAPVKPEAPVYTAPVKPEAPVYTAPVKPEAPVIEMEEEEEDELL